MPESATTYTLGKHQITVHSLCIVLLATDAFLVTFGQSQHCCYFSNIGTFPIPFAGHLIIRLDTVAISVGISYFCIRFVLIQFCGFLETRKRLFLITQIVIDNTHFIIGFCLKEVITVAVRYISIQFYGLAQTPLIIFV